MLQQRKRPSRLRRGDLLGIPDQNQSRCIGGVHDLHDAKHLPAGQHARLVDQENLAANLLPCLGNRIGRALAGGALVTGKEAGDGFDGHAGGLAKVVREPMLRRQRDNLRTVLLGNVADDGEQGRFPRPCVTLNELVSMRAGQDGQGGVRLLVRQPDAAHLGRFRKSGQGDVMRDQRGNLVAPVVRAVHQFVLGAQHVACCHMFDAVQHLGDQHTLRRKRRNPGLDLGNARTMLGEVEGSTE